ncbi:hypothetical protein J3R30DRAFT_3586891 [Lentinula aciculospora]|uniref:RING-type domain-containing protein n=1 Tax=Lentinula aciculospora TaxID=153920 RepID=A0A9W9DEP6_9AGAR|nr:hypothetical protein J3R30DRAFT_3586891 [Lentinula aciculospora]
MEHLELINRFIESLPCLGQDSVAADICCPICLVSFEDIFKDAPAEKPLRGVRGVTMLPSCKHLFCRNDLTEWIRSMHGSCPSCRRVFLNIRPPSDSDGESSDGGEYLPNEEDEEEDSYMLDTDYFDDADEFDFEMEEVDLDMYRNWQRNDACDEIGDASSECSLTDGESLMNSDEEISFESDSASAVHGDGDIIIQKDEDDNFNADPFNDEEK